VKYNPEIVRAYYTQQGLPEPVFEYCHIAGRKFRLDIAWPALKIGLEVQGALWLPVGGHKTGVGIKRDHEKGNLSVLAGWHILYCEPKEVCLLDTVNMIKVLIQLRNRNET